METICPFCRQRHAVSEANIGKQVPCPGCHRILTANPVTCFLWAQSHAPGNFSTLLTGGWVLKEGPCYGVMGLVCLLGIFGIVNLVRALISQQKG
jgi:hypothetical protein